MDLGIKRCRLHVLQSSLSNFGRSRSDMMSISRCYNPCQPGVGGGWKAYLIHLINTLLNFWLRILQKLEEGSDPWEDFPTLPLLAGW